MTINSGNLPKAMQPKGVTMKTSKKPAMSMSKVMKSDKSADAKMSPAMMKKDIAADRKLLASKLATKGKKK